jgi:hypothetical protein
MGFTEYRNGSWSPKKVSQAYLAVKPIDKSRLPAAYSDMSKTKMKTMDNTRLPTIDSFKFYIRSESRAGVMTDLGVGLGDVLDIDVE